MGHSYFFGCHKYATKNIENSSDLTKPNCRSQNVITINTGHSMCVGSGEQTVIPFYFCEHGPSIPLYKWILQMYRYSAHAPNIPRAGHIPAQPINWLAWFRIDSKNIYSCLLEIKRLFVQRTEMTEWFLKYLGLMTNWFYSEG